MSSKLNKKEQHLGAEFLGVALLRLFRTVVQFLVEAFSKCFLDDAVFICVHE